MESHFRLPIQNLLRLGGVTDKQVYFGGPLVPIVVLDIISPIKIDPAKRRLTNLTHGMRFVRGQDKIIALVLLEHPPHSLDVLRSVTPVALCLQIAEE